MGKSSIILFITLFLLTTCLDSSLVTVVIGERHPWEEASGRRFWYTLVYQEGGTLNKLVSPVGTRKAELLPKGKTTILAAYPLGNGAPLVSIKGERCWFPTRKGSLAEALHHLSKFYYEPLRLSHLTIWLS